MAAMTNPPLKNPSAASSPTLSAIKYWLSAVEALIAASRINAPRLEGEPVLFPAKIAAYGQLSQALKLGLRGYLLSFAETAERNPVTVNTISDLLGMARDKYLSSLVELSRSDESLLLALPENIDSIVSDRKRFHPVPHYGFSFEITDRLLAGLLPLCYEVADDDDRSLLATATAGMVETDKAATVLQSATTARDLHDEHTPAI